MASSMKSKSIRLITVSKKSKFSNLEAKQGQNFTQLKVEVSCKISFKKFKQFHVKSQKDNLSGNKSQTIGFLAIVFRKSKECCRHFILYLCYFS